jgi:hypothetical protein
MFSWFCFIVPHRKTMMLSSPSLAWDDSGNGRPMIKHHAQVVGGPQGHRCRDADFP